MRVRKVNRYYCEFCKKANCSKPSMAKHESRCTMNPNRVCRMCTLFENLQHPITEIIALLPDPKKYRVVEENGAEYFGNGLAEAVGTALPEVRKLVENCPACIMAGLRQAGIPGNITHEFDFKKESESWMNDFWAEKRQEYMQSVGRVDC